MIHAAHDPIGDNRHASSPVGWAKGHTNTISGPKVERALKPQSIRGQITRIEGDGIVPPVAKYIALKLHSST